MERKRNGGKEEVGGEERRWSYSQEVSLRNFKLF